MCFSCQVAGELETGASELETNKLTNNKLNRQKIYAKKRMNEEMIAIALTFVDTVTELT